LFKIRQGKRCFHIAKGHNNVAMTGLQDDDEVKPFTPLAANRIRTSEFLRYVASHQETMKKYKDEFQVRMSICG